MTKARINRAIRHLGLEIQNQRGGGYSYFTSLATGDQIGESVMVCYLNQQPLEKWVQDAERAASTINQ
jgi:hypothetical protein